jgi:crotonobetainyl-CoA:carnitine CoA-transferase CaiB-like acyl-CoA transferase
MSAVPWPGCGRRTGAHPGRPLGRADAGRSGRRGDQGRGPEGDDTRRWGPPFIDRDGDRSPPISTPANRGKRSVVADFRTPEGQAKVRELVAGADVLIENFKVGGLAKYGLDYESLRR